MNTESRIELTPDELEHVTGGMDNATKTAIFNFLDSIPMIGAATHTGRVIGNAFNAWNGAPII